MSDRRLAFSPFAVSAFAAVAMLTACSGESYFCDETGCYYCDGVGCREVDPPDRLDCRGDFECREGSVCTDLGCVEECASDDECPAGTECRDGMCVNPTEDPTPIPGVCTTNEDCMGSNLECLDGVCVVREGPGGCDDDADCAAGEVCVDGECRAEEDSCQFSSECGPGRVCVNEVCTTGCTDSTQCPAGLECVDGFCREGMTSPDCTSNEECDAGQICVDGACVAECSTDADCAEGYYCDAGRCRVDDRPVCLYDEDSDCSAPAVALNCQCRSPCVEHADCPRFDVSLQFCLEGYCATTNEATSNCAEAADCEAGQDCVDGNCT